MLFEQLPDDIIFEAIPSVVYFLNVCKDSCTFPFECKCCHIKFFVRCKFSFLTKGLYLRHQKNRKYNISIRVCTVFLKSNFQLFFDYIFKDKFKNICTTIKDVKEGIIEQFLSQVLKKNIMSKKKYKELIKHLLTFRCSRDDCKNIYLMSKKYRGLYGLCYKHRKNLINKKVK